MGELATTLHIAQPAVSKYVRVLREAGLVTHHVRRYYRPNPEGPVELREYFESLWDDALAAFAAAVQPGERRRDEFDDF